MRDIIKRETLFATALLLLVAGVFWLFYRIMAPFFVPLAWGAILVVSVQPLYVRMRTRLGSPGGSALLMAFLVTLVIVVPLVFLTISLVGEVISLYQGVQTEVATRGPEWLNLGIQPLVQGLTQRFEGIIDLSQLNIQSAVLGVLSKISSFVVAHATGVITNMGIAVLQFFLTMMTMYYLFKDGDALLVLIKDSIPLPPSRSEAILAHITNVVRAAIYGGLAVSALQGILGGMMFWILGIPSPVFWGAVMGILTLIPLLGAFVVYLPAGIILAAQGAYIKAIILIVFGLGVVSQIDNFLVPLVLSGRTRLHPLILFFAITGGILVFGFLGIVLGPVVAAVFVAVFDLYRGVLKTPSTETSSSAATSP